MISDLVVVDAASGVSSAITNAVEKMEMSWTMDAVSQIKLTLFDPGMRFLQNNYFPIRRTMTYQGVEFEVAAVEVGPRAGDTAQIVVDLRRSSIQKIKRDKNPTAYSGVSATDYARIVAARYDLKFVGQTTSEKGTITQSGTSSKKESVWDVLTRIAGEAKFIVFESEGTLFFCSEEWLLGKREVIDIAWPAPQASGYKTLEIPSVRRSDDDVKAAEIQLLFHRTNAMNLRPGMTMNFTGVPTFENRYLITEVAYEEGVEEPVSISGRTPEKTEEA
jgi:hypothetical protein